VLLGENGIERRFLALQNLSEGFDVRHDTLHARFLATAPELAVTAARKALEQARLSTSQIDGLVISTCTGYLCPGLTSYVGEKLGLSGSAHFLDLVGHGCGAAIPNLRTCRALLKSGNSKQVLSICVEVCSAAVYLDDDPGVLVSACLFADGAAALVLSAEEPASHPKFEWIADHSITDYQHRELLKFETRNGFLRNVLSLRVPELAGRGALDVCEELLKRAGLKKQEISRWLFHAGGRDVLNEIEKDFQLDPIDLRASRTVLNDFGNVSSPSVLFVLENALRERKLDGWCYLGTFGAGFSSHGALLRAESL
jgi:alkylresorcinol/alkylpyrone synthase